MKKHNSMKHTRLLIALFACINACTLQAQVSTNYAARLQTVLDSTCNRFHIKGASAAIYIPGSGLWKGVHGNSHAGTPISSDMAFPFNSNTKTYIAALMLKLQEEGKLQLNDTIGTWIQNQPNISGQITIRQLLSHTSGLYNYTEAAGFSDSLSKDLTRIWQPAEMLQFVGPPLFAPGTFGSWYYSNTNYLLAGIVAAQVTGMPVEQALRTKILALGGFTHIWFYPIETPMVPIPHFWFLNGGGMVDGINLGYTPEGFYSAASSAGALFGTAEDNVMFWQKIMSGQLLNATSMAQLRQTIALNSNISYGLGVVRYKNINGHVGYGHNGGAPGTFNENLADSVTGVCISVLTNQDSANTDILFYNVISALHKVTNNPPAGITPLTQAPPFKLYPNPAQSYLQLVTPEVGFANAAYRVSDLTGKRVLQGNLNAGRAAIPVAGLENGIYYLQLYTENGTGQGQAFRVAK